MLALVVSLGTAGYMILENWNFLDSLYMTVITISTVGFSEVNPVSNQG
ncbi:MAG: potassium channel family protein, partial [Deltaproteobacteria bacterium]|nr:potassium channel family protein [Deltaproteobacteria bacterium]